MRTRFWLCGAATVLFGGAFGCSALLGVSFGEAVLDDAGTGTTVPGSNTDAALVEGDSGRLDRCAGKKICDVSGDCVTPTPENGCGDPSCKPCSAPFATAFYCDKDGKCQVDGNATNAGCATGRGDCDKAVANGCEASFNDPRTCGGCKTSCDSTSTPLCSPIGAPDGGAGDGGTSVDGAYRCGATCTLGSTQCGNSCVDITTSVDHCGFCGKPCAAVANGSPACRGSQCGATCSAGYSDCANPAAPKTCTPTPKWYRDGDGDGIGAGTAFVGCTPPPGYVKVAGDCEDTNPNVFPGQRAFFGTGYTTGGVVSFDYDCDGTEVGTYDPFPGTCGVDCDGFGYVTTARTGKGVSPYCGSTRYRTCFQSGGGPIAFRALPPAGTCISSDGNATAVPCH